MEGCAGGVVCFVHLFEDAGSHGLECFARECVWHEGLDDCLRPV